MASEFKTCIDCQVEFEITDGERDFITSKVDANGKPFTLPKRCRSCREKKKARFAATGVSAGGSKHDGHRSFHSRGRDEE